MSRVIIILFVFFLFVGVSVTFGQEICTPVDMSYPTRNSTGTGNGPDVEFVVQNVRYMNGQTAGVKGTVVVNFGTVFISQDYVNVRAGYNGCNSPWVYQMFNTYTITRLSDGLVAYNGQFNTGPINCGDHAFCETPEWNTGIVQKQLTLGEWRFDSYIYTIVTVDGVGTYTTPTYHNSVLIEISAE